MHTDRERRRSDKSAQSERESPSGLRERLRAVTDRCLRWLRGALGFPQKRRARTDGGLEALLDGDEESTVGESGPPVLAENDLETTREKGRLRVYDPDDEEAYVESDTWQEIER